MAQAHYGQSLAELEREYERLSPSPDYVDVANLIAFHIHFRLGAFRARARALAEEAYRVAESIGYTEGMAMASLVRGFVLFRDNAPQEATEAVVREAMIEAERLGEPMLQAHALLLLSYWCNRYGAEGDALAYCLIAHDLLTEHPWNVIGRIGILYQLGVSYSRLRQFESAARYYDECHTLCMALDDSLRALVTRGRLAECHFEAQNHAAALALAEAGRTDCERYLATHVGLTATYCNFLVLLAKLQITQGNDAAARRYAEQAKAAVTAMAGWRENELFTDAYFNALTALGVLHQRAGNSELALAYLEEASGMVGEHIMRTAVAELYATLSQIYREQGDFRRALDHFEQYHHYRTLVEATRHYEQIQVVYRLSNAIRVQQATSQLHQENMQLQEVVASLHALHKQVRESAQRDSLTQLYNRRYLEEQLPRLLAEFQRGGAPLSAAMLDMDDFKRINDTFRHTMGDTVLQRIAEVVETALAPGDIAVRYGGDELLVLMPDTPILQAQTRVEAIRRAIQAHDWSVLAPALTVTLSAGVATAQPSDEGMSLVERADANLLTAKRRGKNRLMGAAAR